MEFDENGKPIILERKFDLALESSGLIEQAKKYNNNDYEKAISKLKEFQRLFPIEKIRNLTLQEYCYGFENSFCWWVEEGTKEVAHMFQEGLNRNYGIWFNNKEKQYYTKEGVRKIKINEETAKRRLEEIKRALISIINWARDNRLDEIEGERELWHQAKTKIVYLYFPEKTLPILSKDHLKALCEKIGLTWYSTENHLDSSHNLLIALKQIEPFKDWDSMKISYFIYSFYTDIFKK